MRPRRQQCRGRSTVRTQSGPRSGSTASLKVQGSAGPGIDGGCDTARHGRLKSVLKVLVVDVGGSNIKVWATGHRKAIKIPSGPSMTPRDMVRDVKNAVRNWTYDVVSIGYPGVVLHGRIVSEPHNLGGGWVGFNFSRAFGRPVIVVNDAAMQALCSYRGGRMLFLGLGTGLGAAVIADGVLEPTELAHLPYMKHRTYEDYMGQ